MLALELLDALSLFRNTLFTNYHGGMTQLVSHVWDISLLKEFNNSACFDSYFKLFQSKAPLYLKLFLTNSFLDCGSAKSVLVFLRIYVFWYSLIL